MRGTHFLEIAEGGTCQDMERKQPLNGNSLPGDSRGRDLSGLERIEQGAPTPWRPQREGLVRTWEDSDQARGAHILATTEGGTCQDTERKRTPQGHSPTGDCRAKAKSGHVKNVQEVQEGSN